MIYDSSNGHLYYDADGNGHGARALVAVLIPGVSLSEADIIVI